MNASKRLQRLRDKSLQSPSILIIDRKGRWSMPSAAECGQQLIVDLHQCPAFPMSGGIVGLGHPIVFTTESRSQKRDHTSDGRGPATMRTDDDDRS